MHEVLHKPMIGHIVESLRKANVDRIVVVVGHGAESVKEYLKIALNMLCRNPSLEQDMRQCRQKC